MSSATSFHSIPYQPIDFEGVPLKLGDRVVVGANVCCGICYYCRHDFPYYVSHRFPLRDVKAAVHKAVAADSMKVAIAPWA
jgi:hypothetical protein